MDVLKVLTKNCGSEVDPPVYADVQMLDPLNIDSFMKVLPDITRSKRMDLILNELKDIVIYFDNHIYDSVPHAFAALRDLDFIITSIHTIEANSYKKVRGLEEILEALGHTTNHSPRGCNFTYGLFNPQNDRMRTFTGLNEERRFIHAVHEGTKSLDESLLTLQELSILPIDSERFEILARTLTAQFDSMVPAVVDVMKSVPPEVFSLQIVTFFVALDVSGKLYTGITGAQIQNVAIDFLLYGVDLQDQRYLSYASRNLAAMLPFQKAIVYKTLQKLQCRSLLSKLDDDTLEGSLVNTDQAIKSLDSLQYFLKRILSFRWVHRKLAITNLPLRGTERGSGGYTLDFLEYLIYRTQEAVQHVEELQNRIAH